MMSTVQFFSIASLVLVQMILNTAANDFPTFGNESNDTTQWRFGRSKRSLFQQMPLTLRIRVRYSSGAEMDLKWIKKQHYIANDHLPVNVFVGDLQMNFKAVIGEFVVYGDVDKSSAVVYFKNSNALYGVIGTDHYIVNLPYNFHVDGTYKSPVVGEPYIRRRRQSLSHIDAVNNYSPHFDIDVLEEFLRPLSHNSYQSLKRNCDPEPGPSSKHQRTDKKSNKRPLSHNKEMIGRNYYLETLIFVDCDITKFYKKNYGGHHYIEWIIRHYIIYFSAIEMVFDKLSTPYGGLKMNIAKIVIEDGCSSSFGFMNNENLQFSEVMAKFSQYLDAHQQEFTSDSFDYVLIHTKRTIFSDTTPLQALSRYGRDLFEARKQYQFYEAVPMTVATYQHICTDYLNAAHEIGQILNMEILSGNDDSGRTMQCCSIMQRGGPKCSDCFKWNHESEKQFHTFFKANRNRCVLLNEPRSLRPEGPSKFSSPQLQCTCYGYDSFKKTPTGLILKSLKVDECFKPLMCQNGEGATSHLEPTVLPFDGTICGGTKMCWNRECVPGHVYDARKNQYLFQS